MKFSVSIDPDIARWLSSVVGRRKRYANRSQAIEHALLALRKRAR